MQILLGLLWFICSAAVWLIYHSLFDVVYFKGGCFGELFWVAVIGALIAGLIKAYWFIALPVIALVVYSFIKRSQ